MRLWVLSIIILSANGFALLESSDRSLGEFTGRISKLNTPAGLLRIRVQFQNLRYLTRGDRVDFWSQMGSAQKCQAIIKGKSNDYLLLQAPFFQRCAKHVHFTVGAFLHFYSQDLLDNIQKGKEVIDILLKKRMALAARKRRFEKELGSYHNKVEAVNERYQVLQEKLAKEWRETLSDLENNKSIVLKNIQNTELKLHEVDYKLQQYRVSDQNLELDRWSLDQRLYFKK